MPVMAKDTDEAQGVTMDTRDGPKNVPGVPGRLSGADRSGLGQKGWAEVPEDGAGHPDDNNVDQDFFVPQPKQPAGRTT